MNKFAPLLRTRRFLLSLAQSQLEIGSLSSANGVKPTAALVDAGRSFKIGKAYELPGIVSKFES
jgi:hypothetical protein